MLNTFAEDQKLKTRRDECGELIIPGKQGQLYEYSSEKLGVMFMPPKTKDEPWGKWTPRTWNNFKRSALSVGMSVLQNGDSEGCLAFDPNDRAQVKLAIKIAGARVKKQLSPEQIARQVAVLQKFRLQPKVEGPFPA